MTNKEVYEILHKMGSSVSQEFTQAKLLDLEQVTKHGEKAREGICMAFSHDWIRRVLQNGTPAFAPKPGHDKEKTAADRSALGQLKILGKEKLKAGAGILGRMYENMFNVKNKPFVEVSPAAEAILTGGGFLNPKLKTGKQYPYKHVMEALQKANQDDSVTEQSIWQSQGGIWDSGWSKTRYQLATGKEWKMPFPKPTTTEQIAENKKEMAALKKHQSPRPFANISRLGGKAYTDYPNVYAGIKAALEQLVSGNMAVYIGFRTDANGTQGGHGVAVQRTSVGRYRFFDPNFGTFDYMTPFDAASALLFLIMVAYPESKWQTTKTNKHFEMSYTVFAPLYNWSKVTNNPPELASSQVRTNIVKKALEAVPKVKKGDAVSNVK